jgi:hypothetical protein
MVGTSSDIFFTDFQHMTHFLFVYSCFLEIGTLLMRSMVPVHPVAAAIQSIGIIQRDIEGEGGLGRALLPAILLHGIFDFAAMAMSVIAFENQTPSDDTEENDDYGDDSTNYADNPPDPDLGTALLTLLVGFGILLVGVFYYIVEAKRQRERLYALESTMVNTAVGSNCSSANNNVDNNALL